MTLHNKICQSRYPADQRCGADPAERFQHKRTPDHHCGYHCNRRAFHPQRCRDSQIGRLRFCTAEKFRKEKRADAQNGKQDKAFVEHEAAELIRKQAVRHRFRCGNQKDSGECVKQPEEDQHELRRRQIVSRSRSPRHHADKQQEQYEKDDVACCLSLCEMQKSARDLEHNERTSFGSEQR